MEEKKKIIENIQKTTPQGNKYQYALKGIIKKWEKYTKTPILTYTENHTYTETKKDIQQWETHLLQTKTPTTTRNYTALIKTLMRKLYEPETPQKYTKQDIQQDPKFQQFLIKKQNITPATIRTYIIILTQFSNHIQMTPTEYINQQIQEQTIQIKDNIIIPYNPNNSNLNNEILNWCLQLKNKISPRTIHLYQTKLRAFLKTFNIQLTDKINFNIPTKKWQLLKKSTIKYAIDTGTPLNKALYSFMASTGIRSVDIRNFTIGDFMKATKEYHNSISVEDFIYNAPHNMMGYWEFTPIKTQRMNIQCKVFNSPESSNYLINYLRFRNSKLNMKNKKNNTDYHLKRKYPLFAPYKTDTSEQYTGAGLRYNFMKTNLEIKENEQNILRNKLRNGEIDNETYTDLLSNLPSFTPHQLRKYATSVFANNGVNLRVSALFEGHTAPMVNDGSYVKLDKETLKGYYFKCLTDLSFEKTEVNVVTSDDKRLLEERYDLLLREIEEIKRGVTLDDVNLCKGDVDDLFDF